ncbi:MAG: MurR/RpiR family transcriptional regulator [Candidatus Puniceispirillum sp.]
MDAVSVPPQTYEGLIELITSSHDHMPKRLRDIAQFALTNPEKMALDTLAELAESADSNPSTMVRFAKQLGYSGFSQLQNVFRDRLRGNWASYESRLTDLNDSSPEDIFDSIAMSAARSAMATRENLNKADAKAAAMRIANADIVWLAGSGRTECVASYLSYMLTRIGIINRLISLSPSQSLQELSLAGENDFLCAFSYMPYSDVTIALVDAARRRDLDCVCITDTEVSPLNHGIRLFLKEEDYAGFRTLAASMNMAQYLAIEAGIQKRSMKA